MTLALQTTEIPNLGFVVPGTVQGEILCSCAGITRTDVKAAIADIQAAGAGARITPGRVYKALGKRPQCGSCFEAFSDLLPAAAHGVPAGLLNLGQPVGA